VEVIRMDFTKYLAILFDLDGTLIDYEGAQKFAADHIVELLDLDRSKASRESILRFLESKVIQDLEACKPSAIEPGSSEMRQAFRKAGLDVDPVEFIELYFEGLEEHGEPLPGIAELLGILKRRFTVGIVSNGPGSVQRKRLQNSGLMEFLDIIVLSCEVECAKPDPEILRYAMKLAGSETFSTLFIGDSAGSDMGAANAAGIDFVFVRPDGDFTAPGPRVLEVRKTTDLTRYLNSNKV
jgi:HAD superfamily hydrolase (TIGR01549 family)